MLKGFGLDEIGAKDIVMCEHLMVIHKVHGLRLLNIVIIIFSAGISCIQFDNTRIVSGSWDKTIKVHCISIYNSCICRSVRGCKDIKCTKYIFSTFLI